MKAEGKQNFGRKTFLFILLIQITINYSFALPTGLVAWYPFNGNANDSSVNGNNGTQNGTTYTYDRFGKLNTAFFFDGSSNWISIPSSNNLNFGFSDFTISYWEYRTSSNNSKSVLARDNDILTPFLLGFANSGRAELYMTSNGSTWDIANGVNMGNLILNNWTLYTVCRSGNTFTTYQNGILISTFSSNLALRNSTGLFQIGKVQTDLFYFQGSLDDIRIYNRTLSIEEIKKLYHESGWKTLTDIDGNTYSTVKIGNQLWMRNNLNVSRYNNGVAIPNVTDNTSWANLTSGARCYYNGDSSTYSGDYGALYNWYTVADNKNVCPIGWNVPKDAEWTTLYNYLGGLGIAGGKMKETGTVHWTSPNTGADNSSGFSTVASGHRDNVGICGYILTYGHLWHRSQTISKVSEVSYGNAYVSIYECYKNLGASIRCLKNNPDTVRTLTAEPEDSKVTLKWRQNKEKDFFKYYIYYSTSANPTQRKDSTQEGNISDTLKTISLANGQIQYFRVTAVDSSGLESAFSNEINSTPGNYAPKRPVNLNINTWPDSLKLTWKANTETDINGYIIYKSSQNDTTKADSIGFTTKNYFKITNPGYTNNQYFWVKAKDNAGQKSWFSKILQQLYLTNDLVDADGNKYNTITIGSQIWMKENLKTTMYNDGTAIPNIASPAMWSTLSTPAYCWYNNDAATYKSTYGALYNWYTINTGKLCPSNWHVPDDTEWTYLTNFLGGENLAGGKIKEAGTVHWNSNNGATNESGFTALPSGYISSDGIFNSIGSYCCFWATNEISSNSAETRATGGAYFNRLANSNCDKRYGNSIRCIRDLKSDEYLNINELLNFGFISPNTQKKLVAVINNLSLTDTIHITQTTHSNPSFIINHLLFDVLPGKSYSDTITFSPSIQGYYSDTLLLFGNTPVIKVALKGNCVTNVCSIISTNTTWTKSNSPYFVCKNGLVIEENATLNIEPGVKIILDTASQIRVYGKLLAKGSKNDTIRFIGINNQKFKRILASNNGQLEFNYVKLDSAENAIEAESSSNTTLKISNSKIKGCTQNGINWYGKSISVDSCEISKCLNRGIYINNTSFKSNYLNIHNNRVGIESQMTKDFSITKSKIKNNTDFGFYINCNTSTLKTIEGCYVSGNNEGIYGCYLNIQNDTIVDNTSMGIETSNSVINKNIISRNNSYGIDGCTNNIMNNKISYNSFGIYACNSKIWSNIIYKNNNTGIINTGANDIRYNLINYNLQDGINTGYNDTIKYNSIKNNGNDGIEFNSSPIIKYNNICNNGAYGLRTTRTSGINQTATNNYFCLSDSASISNNIIFDMYDNSSYIKIFFGPFLNDSVIRIAPPSMKQAEVTLNSIKLNWQDNSDSETGFEIQRSTTNGSGYTTIDTTSANATSYTDNGLPSNTTYYFRVRAIVNTTGSDYVSYNTSTLAIFSEQTGIPLSGVSYSSVAWGDYDNDDDLDILLTGASYSKVYKNNGDGTFTVQDIISLVTVDNSEVAWGDYNNDGYLDIIISGCYSACMSYTAKVYKNNKNGTFTEQPGISLTGLNNSSIAWNDYNNDGNPDLLMTGNNNISPSYYSLLYKNNGNNTFSKQSNIALTGVYNSSVAWADYDKDGYKDFLLTGLSNSGSISKLYKNNGASGFIEQSNIFTNVDQSSVAWCDFDNDGYLDVIITGDPMMRIITDLYRNNGDNTFTKKIATTIDSVAYSSVAWADYDNDGNSDLLISGYNTTNWNDCSKIFKNNGNGTFSEENINLAAVNSGSVAWGDYDNDGDDDILLTGNNFSKIYKNNTIQKNTPPDTVKFLKSTYLNNIVTLKWKAPKDDKTPSQTLAYNVFVYSATDTFVMPNANPKTGFLKTPDMGNAQLDTFFIIKTLAPGKYYWTVQAIDQSFKGGVFAPIDSFTITSNPLIFSQEKAEINTLANTSKSVIVKIENTGNDTLRISNISGLASPFSTNVVFPVKLSKGDSLKINVTFNGSSKGKFLDTLLITSNATNYPIKRISLIGSTLTPLCGSINKDSVLTKAKSPYLITCNLIVIKGKTLTIEPGTKIIIDSLKRILVYGSIIANGSATDSIIITNHEDDKYSNIDICDSAFGSFTYVRFENGKNGIKGESSRGSQLNVSNFIINNCDTGINWTGGSAYIDKGIFTNGFIGAYLSSYMAINNNTGYVKNSSFKYYSNKAIGASDIQQWTFQNNNIFNNNIGIECSRLKSFSNNIVKDNNNYGIYIAYADSIKNNIVTNNNGIGIQCPGNGGILQNNTVSNNTSHGIQGYFKNILNNTIINNSGHGFASLNMGSNKTIKYNIISGNQNDGINTFNNDTIKYNTITNNGGDGIEANSLPIITNNNICGNTGYVIKATSASGNITATNNFFCTTTASEIENVIYDVNDGGNCLVSYTPFLTDSAFYSPSNFIASKQSMSSITLSWQDINANISGFELQRSTINGSGYTTIASPNANVNSYKDINLSASTNYYYRIKTLKGTNSSEYVNLSTSTTATFSEIPVSNLPGVENCSAAWGDYDNDGDLDIVISGCYSACTSYFTKIFRNNNGNFEEQSTISLTAVRFGSVNWGDYDNDGDLDLLISGTNSSGIQVSKLFRNNFPINSFTEQSSALVGVNYCSNYFGDFNNDGYLDILISGSVGADGRITYLYKNNGNGTFNVQNNTQLIQVSNSSIAYADYNKDGLFDIFLTGHTGSSVIAKLFRNIGNFKFEERKEVNLTGIQAGSISCADFNNDNFCDVLYTGDDGITPKTITKLYKNSSNNSFSEVSVPLTSTMNGSIEWGDFNNDGLFDILIAGSNSAKIFKNNGSDNFSTEFSLQNISSGRALWGDYDNDGDLDILLIGSGYSKIYRNNLDVTNTPPSAPKKLPYVLTDTTITLRWNSVVDKNKPARRFSYNFYVSSKKDSVNKTTPMANITTGFRRIPAMGNAQLDTFFILKNLPAGKYYWSVQAVDQAYLGGPFASVDSFAINSVTIKAPKNLSATPDDGSAILQWSKNTEFDLLKYFIYKGESTNSMIKYDSTLAGNTDATKTISGLENGKTYYLYVTAMNTNRLESGPSNIVQVTPAINTAPAAPQNLTAIAGNGQVLLKWNKNSESDFLKYRIYVAVGAGSMSQCDSIMSITDTSRIIKLPNSVLHYLQVTAVDKKGLESTPSNKVTATPNTNLAPFPPQNLLAIGGNGTVTLKWNKNTEPNFRKYIIYKGTSATTLQRYDSTSIGMPDDTSRVISPLANGTKYYFYVTAINTNWLESKPSNTVTAIPIVTYTISGYVFNSGTGLKAGNEGLKDVVMYCKSILNGTVSTATTNIDGYYLLTVPNTWKGIIKPIKVGYNFTPDSLIYDTIPNNLTNQNFSTVSTTSFTISGNAGIAGATVYFGDKYVIADSYGDYTITVAQGWTGDVYPNYSGYSFAPSKITYTNVSSYYVGQNYTATLLKNEYIISGNAGIAGATLTIPGFSTSAATSAQTALVIRKISSPPKIDGIIDNNDPWLSSKWVTLGANKTSSNTTSSMSSKFQLVYDDNNLYFTIRVEGDDDLDTSGVNITNFWELDCVELFYKTDTTSASDGAYEQQGTYQFRMRRASVFPDRFDVSVYNTDKKTIFLANNKDFKVSQFNESNAYTQEWQMPWSALTDNISWSKKFFKFEIQNADNTTGQNSGRTQQIFWRNNSDSEWRDTRTFSVVELGTSTDYVVTTDASGKYSFKVPANWKGSVVPSKPGYKFAPEKRDYTNVILDKINQDYTATVFEEKPLIAAISNLCPGDSATLRVSNASTSGEYYWYEENKLLNTKSASSIRVKLFERKYTVYDSATNELSNSAQITWNPLPPIGITPPKIYAGGNKNSIIYFATDARGTNIHYHWYKGDDEIPNSDKYYCITKAEPGGIYYLKITQDNGCSTFSIPDTLEAPQIKSGVTDNVSLNPNPAKNEVNVNIGNSYRGEARFIVYDMMGRNWYQARIPDTEEINSIKIPLTGMPKGYYCIEIINPVQPVKRLMFLKQ